MPGCFFVMPGCFFVMPGLTGHLCPRSGSHHRLISRLAHQVAEFHQGELDVQSGVHGCLVAGFTLGGDTQSLEEELVGALGGLGGILGL